MAPQRFTALLSSLPTEMQTAVPWCLVYSVWNEYTTVNLSPRWTVLTA